MISSGQHGRRCPEEHGGKLKFARRMEGMKESMQITSN
jgi:hypothetical protein